MTELTYHWILSFQAPSFERLCVIHRINGVYCFATKFIKFEVKNIQKSKFLIKWSSFNLVTDSWIWFESNHVCSATSFDGAHSFCQNKVNLLHSRFCFLVVYTLLLFFFFFAFWCLYSCTQLKKKWKNCETKNAKEWYDLKCYKIVRQNLES